ncbi:MAG TPA: N-acetylmuramic acid 6-phosphate etherase [Phycisphaerales bacterium]|nr:N-acetylmuramic acid 6-phosphate etherase [Phycisphaerales bacterium]HRQ74522.1 N-acetylmuramic acid 6-phosphate etherase [Phycisphaerales bacterium]
MLPPDRSHLRTEQRHEASHQLDALSIDECVRLMIDDHRAVTDALAAAHAHLAALIDAIVPRMREGGRIIYLGAGTSGRLGVLDASECPPTFQTDPGQVIGIIAGGDAALRRSSEGREDELTGAHAALDELSLHANDTVIGIAAGGTTPYVLGAILHAKRAGCMTALITCVALAAPPEGCDRLIFLDTGPELLTGSTRLKAGSATKLALNIISTAVFTQLGKVYSNLMVDLRATNAKLRDRAMRILMELCPELSREEAAKALDNAGGDLKAAIVMQRLDVDFNAATDLLNQHGRKLRNMLG